MKSKLQDTKGSALLITLALMFMIAGLAIMALDRANTDVDLSYSQVHEEQAFYVAEAGVERAYATIYDSVIWRTGYSDVDFGEGAYSVVVVDSASDSALIDTVILRSTGEVDNARATIEMVLLPIPNYPFVFGLFGDAWIDMDKNTCTDSYNSDSGTYAGTVLDSMGDVGSNGTVTSAKDVTFGGGISVATPGGITNGPFNVINGDTTTTADSVVLDVTPQAEFDWANANNHAMAGLSGTNFSYDNITKKLYVGAFGNVNLDGGTYYFSEIVFDQNAVLTIDATESVDIYVTGNVTLGQGSTMNDNGQPTDMMIWSQGDSLSFNQDNTFYGTFYGPNAHIQYDQTTQAYGALIGGTVKLDQGACFHYDRQLGSYQKGEYLGYSRFAWGEPDLL